MHLVLLHLGDVVADVVEHLDLCIGAPDVLAQDVSQVLGERGAVGERVVARRLHRLEVRLTFAAVEGCRSQLSVRESDVPPVGVPRIPPSTVF